MMGKCRQKLVKFTPGGCIFLSVLLLTIPLKWALSWLLAAIIHEFFHILAIIICGSHINTIKVGAFGAQIHTGLSSWGKEVLCAAAGPAGGALLLLTARIFPILALCALVQTTFNLIPIFPFDGGRVLNGLLYLLFPNKAERLGGWLEKCTLVTICGFTVITVFRFQLGMLPIVFAIITAVRILKRKSSCNAVQLRVQ